MTDYTEFRQTYEDGDEVIVRTRADKDIYAIVEVFKDFLLASGYTADTVSRVEVLDRHSTKGVF